MIAVAAAGPLAGVLAGMEWAARQCPDATWIVTAATDAGMSLHDVQITRPDLESVFLHLTGKALRD